MKIEYIPIAEEALLSAQLPIDNSALYKECCLIKERNPQSAQHSNVGGYQTPALFRHMINDYPIFCELIDSIQLIIDNYIKQFNYETPRRVEIGNFWLNFNGPHHSNDYHTHPHSVFSGAYYITAPQNCGSINFFRVAQIADTEWGHFFCNSSAQNDLINRYMERIEPTPGRLVLFPSYYPHSVSPNRSDDMRLSLSFNSQAVYG